MKKKIPVYSLFFRKKACEDELLIRNKKFLLRLEALKVKTLL